MGKLCLNTLWGKLAQRPDLLQTQLFSDPEKYFAVVADDDNEIGIPEPLSETVVLLPYKRKEGAVPLLLNTNAMLASFVTAYGRLKLYSYMEKLGPHLLYGDTDSVVFEWDLTLDGAFPLHEGRHLGDLTNEVAQPGHWIGEFVSTGPKSYAYKVRSAIPTVFPQIFPHALIFPHPIEIENIFSHALIIPHLGAALK